VVALHQAKGRSIYEGRKSIGQDEEREGLQRSREHLSPIIAVDSIGHRNTI
jgi:hypothetical protein